MYNNKFKFIRNNKKLRPAKSNRINVMLGYYVHYKQFNI